MADKLGLAASGLGWSWISSIPRRFMLSYTVIKAIIATAASNGPERRRSLREGPDLQNTDIPL